MRYVTHRHQRSAAYVQSVKQDKALGAFLAYLLDETACYTVIFFLVASRNLVQQIHAQCFVRYVFVPFGEHAPLVCASFQCFGISEEVLWFLGLVDTVSWRTMKIQTDVKVIFLTPFHTSVQVFHHALISFIVLARLGPAPVRERYAHIVESPILNPLEFLLSEGEGTPVTEVVQQIETSPSLHISLRLGLHPLCGECKRGRGCGGIL